MQTKLTLRLDSALIEMPKIRAHDFAKSQSQIVEDYFKLLSDNSSKYKKVYVPLPPITKALSGILKANNLSEKDYKKYLKEKHS